MSGIVLKIKVTKVEAVAAAIDFKSFLNKVPTKLHSFYLIFFSFAPNISFSTFLFVVFQLSTTQDENNSGESEVDDSNDDGDDDEESLDELEVLDSLVSSGGSSKQEAAPTPAAPAPAQEWAVNVNVSTSVDDFHQKVPQMAHQVAKHV